MMDGQLKIRYRSFVRLFVRSFVCIYCVKTEPVCQTGLARLEMSKCG